MAAELPDTLEGRFSVLLDRLAAHAQANGRRAPRRGARGAYMACCPAHDDKHPSLSVVQEGSRILAHCFAGCSVEDVVGAVGFPMEGLFGDYRKAPPAAQPRVVWDRQQALAEEARAWAESVHEPERLPLPPSLSEFRALEYAPIRHLLGPWATQQINLVFAGTGAGKTQFCLSLAYAMVARKGLCGWEHCGEPLRVLYVDAEMAPRMMQDRLAGLDSDHLFLANLAGWWAEQGGDPLNLTTEAAQGILNAWIDGLGIDVVILDNFMNLAWKEGTSFSSDEIWTPFRRWMVGLRAQDKCVILVDHANASGKLYGTKTKEHLMDLILTLEAAEELDDEDPFVAADSGAWTTLRFHKWRGLSDSSPLIESREAQVGLPDSPWAWRAAVDPFLQNVRAMRENGMSIRDIAKDLGVGYSKVQRLLKRHGDL